MGTAELNKLLKKLQETVPTAKRGSTESIHRIFLVFYSVIFIHKLDIMRKECH